MRDIQGCLYTWGNGKHCELGDGFQEIRLNPQQINLATHRGEPVVMVSCGASHTVLLTEAGCVWTCGDGRYGKRLVSGRLRDHQACVYSD